MKKYRLAVSALVLGSPQKHSLADSILLVHKPRKNDAWQLPQGGVEEGESLEQAALRELQEEAGISLSHVDFVSDECYTYDFPMTFLKRYNPINSGQCLKFVVIKTSDLPLITVDNDEIDSYAWVLPEELPKYLTRKAYLDVVMNVLMKYREAASQR